LSAGRTTSLQQQNTTTEIFKSADNEKSNKGETSCNKDKEGKQLG